MMGDFQLRINDTKHEIQLPDDQIARLLLVNEDNEVYTGECDILFNFYMIIDGCNQAIGEFITLFAWYC